MLGDALIESSVTANNTSILPPLFFIIIMYIELREKNSKYFVIIHEGDSKLSPNKAAAQFASTNKLQAENVAKQYAKQKKCLIRYTTGGIETPELPPQPAGEA